MLNTKIILVHPTHPGNIGATARAMKNMGLSQLTLVQPKQFPHAEATVRASGADDILANVVVCDTLEQALVDCQLVLGTSARDRRLEWPSCTPRAAAKTISELPKECRAAIVDVNFLDMRQPRKLMHRLRRLFQRAQLSTTEIHILRGFLSAVDKKIN